MKCETMAHRGQEFYVASRNDVISAKRAAGRPKDLEDARVLELGPEKYR
jgi:hypothetical protein